MRELKFTFSEEDIKEILRDLYLLDELFDMSSKHIKDCNSVKWAKQYINKIRERFTLDTNFTKSVLKSDNSVAKNFLDQLRRKVK
jgi:hypothetical protein